MVLGLMGGRYIGECAGVDGDEVVVFTYCGFVARRLLVHVFRRSTCYCIVVHMITILHNRYSLV
jgi:hypothetical protein